ncbi:hypothetical protein [Nitratifractor sp.]
MSRSLLLATFLSVLLFQGCAPKEVTPECRTCNATILPPPSGEAKPFTPSR